MQVQVTPETQMELAEGEAIYAQDAAQTLAAVPAEQRRVASEAAARSLQDVETSVQQWHQEWRTRMRGRRARELKTTISVSVLLIGCVFALLLLVLSLNVYFVACGGAALALFIVDICGRHPQSSAAPTVETIAEMEDARAIGPLLRILDEADAPEQEHIYAVLTRLLPRLDEAGARLLTSYQWHALHGCISNTLAARRPEFVLACLDTVERVGNADAFLCLTLLAVQDAPTKPMQAARARAKQCLHVLTGRLDFGTVADIPGWIAKLPVSYGENNRAFLAHGATWEECLSAVYALTRLLPQLTPAHDGLLNPNARRYLGNSGGAAYCALSHGGTRMVMGGITMSRLGSDYDRARLAAFEQIGTGSDIAYAQACMDSVPTGEAPFMRARIQEVVRLLEARRDREAQGQTLLRAAGAPISAPDQLLRPVASDAAPTPADELLRANSKPMRT